MLIAQVADAARLAPVTQVVLVSEKSPTFAPVIETLLIVIEEAVPFFSVAVCAALVEPTVTFPNAMDVGLTETVAAVPRPVRATVRGLPGMLKFNVALRVPVAVGAKATYTTQLDDAPSDDPHVVALAFLKSLASAPANEKLNVIPLAFEFVRLTNLSAPVLPSATKFQPRLVGKTVAAAKQLAPFNKASANGMPIAIQREQTARRDPFESATIPERQREREGTK
jgi:hypothetical protein